MASRDVRTEAFAMAAFILQVNTLRTLVSNGTLSRAEALDIVDAARVQLDGLIAANRSDRTTMLDAELLDYEALFRDIDDRAAEDLLRTLKDALNLILEETVSDQEMNEAEALRR